MIRSKSISFLFCRAILTPLSKDESRVLALQQINRLNQRIGQIARSSKENMTEMKILQTQVNRLTIGVKTDNRSADSRVDGFREKLH